MPLAWRADREKAWPCGGEARVVAGRAMRERRAVWARSRGRRAMLWRDMGAIGGLDVWAIEVNVEEWMELQRMLSRLRFKFGSCEVKSVGTALSNPHQPRR